MICESFQFCFFSNCRKVKRETHEISEILLKNAQNKTFLNFLDLWCFCWRLTCWEFHNKRFFFFGGKYSAFILIYFRHWLKIRTYSNLWTCFCFLWIIEAVGLFCTLQLLRFTGESRWASKRRFLLNRRFTTFALTSALGKVIYFFTVMNFYEVWVWCLRTIWHLRFFPISQLSSIKFWLEFHAARQI